MTFPALTSKTTTLLMDPLIRQATKLKFALKQIYDTNAILFCSSKRLVYPFLLVGLGAIALEKSGL